MSKKHTICYTQYHSCHQNYEHKPAADDRDNDRSPFPDHSCKSSNNLLVAGDNCFSTYVARVMIIIMVIMTGTVHKWRIRAIVCLVLIAWMESLDLTDMEITTYLPEVLTTSKGPRCANSQSTIVSSFTFGICVPGWKKKQMIFLSNCEMFTIG